MWEAGGWGAKLVSATPDSHAGKGRDVGERRKRLSLAGWGGRLLACPRRNWRAGSYSIRLDFEVGSAVAEGLEEAVAAALDFLRAQVCLSVESSLPYNARFA